MLFFFSLDALFLHQSEIFLLVRVVLVEFRGMFRLFIFFSSLFLLASCSPEKAEVFTIETNVGDIKVKLYDETPFHRDNFRKLVRDGYYEGILFHRVIGNFVIQAGDPDSRHARPNMILGAGEIGYQIVPEIKPGLFHKRGVLAAARESDNVNPERKSSGSHFYIVQGRTYAPAELDSAVKEINARRLQALFERLKEKHQVDIHRYEADKDYDKLMELNKQLSEESRKLLEKEKLILTEEQKNAYTTVGGIPSLDGAYTVFGEVVDGMDVVDKIAAMETDENDRPVKDVIILKIK